MKKRSFITFPFILFFYFICFNNLSFSQVSESSSSSKKPGIPIKAESCGWSACLPKDPSKLPPKLRLSQHVIYSNEPTNIDIEGFMVKKEELDFNQSFLVLQNVNGETIRELGPFPYFEKKSFFKKKIKFIEENTGLFLVVWMLKDQIILKERLEVRRRPTFSEILEEVIKKIMKHFSAL